MLYIYLYVYFTGGINGLGVPYTIPLDTPENVWFWMDPDPVLRITSDPDGNPVYASRFKIPPKTNFSCIIY